MIFQSFAVPSVRSTLKNHQKWQKFGKIWRTYLFNLPYTHFSTTLPKPETRVSGTLPVTRVSSRCVSPLGVPWSSYIIAEEDNFLRSITIPGLFSSLQ